MLAFQLAHAQARDAVHAAVDFAAIELQLRARPSIRVASRAPDRSSFLRRPDLGRTLDPVAAERLGGGPWDVVFVVADGLSATAVQQRAVPFLEAALDRLPHLSIGPIVLASQARVALGDEIGERVRARLSVVLIGERPGLSVSDSLGIYLTYGPRRGLKDSDRNCISNIHASGLTEARAAAKLAWLVGEALRRHLTGVQLKDDVDEAAIAAAASARLIGP